MRTHCWYTTGLRFPMEVRRYTGAILTSNTSTSQDQELLNKANRTQSTWVLICSPQVISRRLAFYRSVVVVKFQLREDWRSKNRYSSRGEISAARSLPYSLQAEVKCPHRNIHTAIQNSNLDSNISIFFKEFENFECSVIFKFFAIQAHPCLAPHCKMKMAFHDILDGIPFGFEVRGWGKGESVLQWTWFKHAIRWDPSTLYIADSVLMCFRSHFYNLLVSLCTE